MGPSQYHAVKSLNKSQGRRRFVFKNFSQRVEEIEIDVYRSLDPLKSEPADGSSFFRESLVYWRELNTAEDFISLYEEMMPWVQTLPQILLHKETIISKLLCRLKMQAQLSLEPILRLIAALSRDLLEEFLPFLQRIADSLVDLLKAGGDREPDILEQVFTSWSYIMMYLHKYLVRDIVHILKITAHLRYYPKDYVQEFMAEAMSFLLRNSPNEQLIKGIRKIIFEVAKKPSPGRKVGVSALLWHVLRGTSSRLHSRAKKVLLLLLDSSTIGISDKFTPGSDTVVEVVTGAFQRLWEELDPVEVNLILNCLTEEISGCVSNECFLQLSRLLSLLISTLQFKKGGKNFDYQSIVLQLIEAVIKPSASMKNTEDHSSELVNKTLQLMICVLDVLSDPSTLSRISMQWAPVFKLRDSSLLTFIKGLLEKDPGVPYTFRRSILSALNDFVEASPDEVLCLMLTFFERLRGKLQLSEGFDGILPDEVSRICDFFRKMICCWTMVISDATTGSDQPTMQICESNLALLWGVVRCYPYVFGPMADLCLLMNLIKALDQLLEKEADEIAGFGRPILQSLVGVSLISYHKCLRGRHIGISETSNFLHFAKKYKSSSQVLFAVAEFLDSTFSDRTACKTSDNIFHPDFEVEKGIDAIRIYADNLAHPDKSIRLSTLRILSHYEPIDRQLSITMRDQHALKKLKVDGSQQSCESSHCSNVIQILLSIEATPLSISTSRKIAVLISRIQVDLSADRISEAYAPILLNGIIGIFHNRFGHLWEPAKECLTILITKHVGLVWDRFVSYLENFQLKYLAAYGQLENFNSENSKYSNALDDSFKSFATPVTDSTPCSMVLVLLLQSIQKVPVIAESKSRQLIPLFFKILGYNNDDTTSKGSVSRRTFKGKEWRLVLKEWLNLLKLMHNPRSLYRSQLLKEALINRLLDDTDSDIQLKVLDCLLNWKDDFLLPYEQHLKNLIASKNLREELTTWSLSKEYHHIQEDHRGDLIPLVIRTLMPKVRKLKTLGKRKHAGVNHRKAILSCLSQLDVLELPLFFSLLLKPLMPGAYGNEGFENRVWSSSGSFLDEFQSSNLVGSFCKENILDLSWKKRCGFLHVIEDVLSTFDEPHISPFLNLLMTFVVRILESCTLNLINAKPNDPSIVVDHSSCNLPADESFHATEAPIMTDTTAKQFKDLRSLCLKIISSVLNKYDHHDFGSQFWEVFFMAVKPLIDSFKQEGSSSEKPSSLFSCFMAMSRSPSLVLLLDWEKNLVPTIFSMLTVRTASDAIIACVLSFVENLLNIDNELEDDEDCAIRRIIHPHIDKLIQSLHTLFHSHKITKRKSVTWPEKIELRIFKLLVKYIKQPSAAREFVDIMLPLLAKKDPNSDECVEALHIMEGILPVLGCESTGKILNAVHPLLISAGLNMRLSICNILDALAVNDPSLAFLAKLICELNAMSVIEIDELDYDTRVNAYEAITPNLFSSLKEDHALVLLSHFVYDMRSEELILRQSASRALLSFIQFAAALLEHEEMDSQDVQLCDETNGVMMPLAGGKISADFSWTRACIHRIINNFLLMHVGDAMSKDISIQKEWITVLRDMVLNLQGIPALNSFRPLCSDDAEVDFFNNILHLQKHRRARALLRFRNVITAGSFSERIAMKVFVPLFFNMLFDIKDGKGEHVRNSCSETLAFISSCLQWDSYHMFLMRCFREMTLKPNKHKVLLRLICSILDSFHFYETSGIQDPGENCCKGSHNNTTEGNSATILARNCFTSHVPEEIQVSLEKTILPQLQNLLASDTESVNVIISLAALKLLKLLPLDVLESQLPSIVHRISNSLKNRLESIRDEARSALAACCRELGLEYLHFILKVLQATLKRGYELHVLGYTLNFILSKTLSSASVGKLDYCLEEVLSVVENDILGDVAEEKEVEKIASKMKETRKNKSFDTLKLISQNITFRTHALKLLSPIHAHLQKHLTQTVNVKLETMLHHIAAGIECNPSVDQTDLFIFAYELIEDGITEENMKVKNSEMTKTDKQCNKGMIKKENSGKSVGNASQSSHLIVVFALRVLHSRLKKVKFAKKDEQLSMLDPFVGLLRNCLSSKFEDVLSVSLKCLAPLIRLPLPSLEVEADVIKSLLLDFARKSVNTGNPLTESCLKLLTALLRSTSITLSSEQLHTLVHLPLFVDLESNPSFVALSLLKAIIGRKLIVPEIYDVVTQIAELMVTSQLEPIRKKCSQILLQFLLDYQLSEKRLQQHLDFLLANLSYEHASGREAVLEMIHAVIVKFPKSIVDSQAQTFFLHLVVCLANDKDNKVRSMVGAAIKLLIGRTSQHALHHILQYSLSWYAGEKPHLWSAAAQVLGLLVEVLKKGFQSHISEILQVTQNILTCAIDMAVDREWSISNEATIPFWKEAYYSLIMLEKILEHYPELYLEKDLEEIWEAIGKFLLHPHMWLRNLSSRLVALYFAAVSESKRLHSENLDMRKSLMNPSSLFTIAVSLCCQLKAQLADVPTGNIITQNLVFAICGLHSFARQKKCSYPHKYWSTLELHEKDHFCKAFELLGSKKAKVMFQSIAGNDSSQALVFNDQNGQNRSEDLPSLLVVPLLKKMGKLALQKEDIQMKVVFNCFQLISSQIGSEGCHDYAMHMLLPLYKVCEGFAGKVITDEVKEFAQDIRNSMEKILGSNFVQVYNLIRKNLKAKRDKRKQEEKLMAVINPMRNAKRKLRIAAKHREHKRRKIITMKMGRRW